MADIKFSQFTEGGVPTGADEVAGLKAGANARFTFANLASYIQTGAGYLQAANNLSDLTSIPTAKTNLGLNLVENVALSTWAGSTNLTTLGTIATGVWNGTAISLAYGGTGGTSLATAQNSLIIAKRTAIADADGTVSASDKVVSYTSISTNRTLTLCAASAVTAGTEIIVTDESGSVTSSKQIIITRAGADTINNTTSINLIQPYGSARLISNGVSKWTAVVYGMGGGNTSTALGNAFAGTNTSSCAFGNGALATGNNAIAIGFSVTASGNSSVAIGGNSTTATASNAIAIGYNSDVTAANGIGIGQGCAMAGASGVAVGDSSAISTGAESVAIGHSAAAGSVDQYCTAVGASSLATEVAAAFGYYAQNSGRGANVLGTRSFTDVGHATIVGYAMEARETEFPSSLINPIVLGGDSLTNSITSDVWFNNGWAAAYNANYDGTAANRTATACPVKIHGMRGLDARGTPTNTDVAGGDIYMIPGEGTGTAAGGSFFVQLAPAGGVSNNTLNNVANAFKVSLSTTARDTWMMVYDVDNATLERVTVGIADSGGAGFKLLCIPN